MPISAGYLHPAYAAALAEFGEALRLPGSKSWLLKRRIPSTGFHDAMGCYPLFCCAEWEDLADDLSALQDQLVSVVVVADPLNSGGPRQLEAAFDSVSAFKDHFVIETGRPLPAFVTRSHREQAQRALNRMNVEVCAYPLDYLDDWERLFGVLCERHRIQGLRRFSRSSFAQQLAVPGLVMVRASLNGRTVGLDLWYVQGDCAHGHLAAFDAVGYDLHASYATKWRAIELLSDRVRWINLGAGNAGDPQGGLSRFKRGWSTGTRTAWLCGRVLQPARYKELLAARGSSESTYFPAYRAGEFA
jgi:hypothetical protein